MNRKTLLTSLLMMSLATPEAYSFVATGKYNLGVGSSSPGNSSSSNTRSSSIAANASKNKSGRCKLEDVNKKDHISLELVKALMVDRNSFKVSKVDGNTHRITIPNLVGAGCFKNKFELDTVQVEKGLGVAFKLKNEEPKDKRGYEQLKKCFQDKGIMDGDKFLREKVTEEHLVDFSFDIEVEDIDESSIEAKKLYFISPDRDPAKLHPTFPHLKVGIESNDFKKCYSVESHVDGGYAIYKNRKISEAYAACSSNDLKKMLSAYTDLDPSLAGNAKGAFKLAQKALELAMKDQLEENKKEIFKKLKAYKNDELDEAYKSLNKGDLEEEEAEQVVEGYAELLNELDETVINPAIREIEALLKELKGKGVNKKRERQIKKRISALNKIIGEFARHRTKYGADKAKEIAKKFALIDEGAKDIIGFQLKSETWAKVGKGSGKISPEKAKKRITKKLENFERVARKWEKEYDDVQDADSGSFRPAQDARVRAVSYSDRIRNTREDYFAQEKKYSEYCKMGFFGVRNPARCNRMMNPRAIAYRRDNFMRRESRLRRGEDFYYGREHRLRQMAVNARQRDRYERDDFFFDDFGFSDFDDPYFMDRNPYDRGGYADYSYSDRGYAGPMYGQGNYGRQMSHYGNNGYRSPAGNFNGYSPNYGNNRDLMGMQPSGPYNYGGMPPQYPMMYGR